MALNSSSQINSSSINAAYPVAGVSQSTQGFRDNFSNIQVALSTAASEITSLNNAVNNISGATVTFSGDVLSRNAIQLTGQVSISLTLSSINNQSQNYSSSKDDIVMTVNKDGRVIVTSITPYGTGQTISPSFTTVKNSSGTSISSITIPTFNVNSAGKIDLTSLSSINISNFGLFGYQVKSNSIIYSNSSGTTDYLHVSNPYNVLVTDSNSNIGWSVLSISSLGDVNISSPSEGQVLVFDGVNWSPATLSGDGTSIDGENGIISSISGSKTTISLNYQGLTNSTPTTDNIIAVYNPDTSSYYNVSLGQLSSIVGSGSTSIENDPSPTLSANLNLNGNNIVSNSNITIQTTNGTVSIGSIKFPSSLPTTSSVLVCDTSGNITWGTNSNSGSGNITVGPGLSLTTTDSSSEIDLAIDRLHQWDAGSGTGTINPSDMIMVYANPVEGVTATSNPGSGLAGYCYITPQNILNYLKNDFIYNNTLTSDLILNGNNLTSGYSITISNTVPATSTVPDITISSYNNLNLTSGKNTQITSTSSVKINSKNITLTGSGSTSSGTLTITDSVVINSNAITLTSSGAVSETGTTLSHNFQNFSGKFVSYDLKLSNSSFINCLSGALTIGDHTAFSTTVNGSSVAISATTTSSITSSDVLIMGGNSVTVGSPSGSLSFQSQSTVFNTSSFISQTTLSTLSVTETGISCLYNGYGLSATSSGIAMVSASNNLYLDDTNKKINISSTLSGQTSSIVVQGNKITLTSPSLVFGTNVWPAGAAPANSFLTTDANGNMLWEAISENDSVTVSNLATEYNTLSGNVSNLQSSVTTNTNNIQTNANNITTNTNDISNLKTRVTASETNISNISTASNTNTTNISALRTSTSKLTQDGSGYGGDVSTATIPLKYTESNGTGTIILGNAIDTLYKNQNTNTAKLSKLSSDGTAYTGDISAATFNNGNMTPNDLLAQISAQNTINDSEITANKTKLTNMSTDGSTYSGALKSMNAAGTIGVMASQVDGLAWSDGTTGFSASSAGVIANFGTDTLLVINEEGAGFTSSAIYLQASTTLTLSTALAPPSTPTSAGMADEIRFDDTNGIIWRCVTGGTAGSAKWVKYNSSTAPSTINTQTANYTLVQNDCNGYVVGTSSSSMTFTVPSLSSGTTINIIQGGTGKITFSASSGVTLISGTGASGTTISEGATVSLIWITTTTVVMTGQVS